MDHTNGRMLSDRAKADLIMRDAISKLARQWALAPEEWRIAIDTWEYHDPSTGDRIAMTYARTIEALWSVYGYEVAPVVAIKRVGTKSLVREATYCNGVEIGRCLYDY